MNTTERAVAEAIRAGKAAQPPTERAVVDNIAHWVADALSQERARFRADDFLAVAMSDADDDWGEPTYENLRRGAG